MGFAASGACYPDKSVALKSWCSGVEPGNTFSSCASCDSTTSTCLVSYQPSTGGVTRVKTVEVSTPSCDVPTPVDDAVAYSGAIIALWAAVWAGKQLYNFFRVPHADV